MSKGVDTKESILYTCPNKCEDPWFYQDGTVEVRRQLSEDGETMEDDSYDFTPKGPVKCYRCEAEAKIGKRIVTTTIETVKEV